MSSNLIPLLNHSICIAPRRSLSSDLDNSLRILVLPLIMKIIFFRLIDFSYSEKYSSSRFILKVHELFGIHRKLNSIRVSFIIWFHLSTGWYNFKKFSKWFSRWRIESRFKQKKFNSLSSQFQDSLHCDSKVILAKLRDAIQ